MLDLYYLPGSSPCRAVLMVAEAIGVQLNLHILDLMAGEHRTPEFTRLNPQRSIPTLVDGETVLCESRAILLYLCDRYATDEDTCYPQDILDRAAVHQRLFFDACVLYPRFTEFYHPQVFGRAPADEAKRRAFERAITLLDTFLGESEFVAGPKMTVADISIFATMATACALRFQLEPFPNVERWYAQMVATCPGAKQNAEGAQLFLTYK
ncbi:GSTD2 protein [Anopheles sinensis]|uniref:glutathione transferase n=1 Tax=Anopheles sinensis TaxID=74873 RepID=A0A084WTJ5_ANOSI|nr:GSTD2 protein [Anopheles sinensis]